MIPLLLRDFKVARFYWLPAVFFYVFFIATFVQFNLLYLSVNMVLCFAAILAVPIIDYKQGIDAFLCSLPVKRADVVRARYLSAGLTVFACLTVLLVCVPFVVELFKVENARPDILLSPAGALSFLLPMVTFLSLYFPLYFRLGLGRSLLVLMPAGFSLAALAAAAGRLAALLSHRPVGELFPLDVEIMSVPYKPLLPLASSLKSAMGAPGLYALLLAVVAGTVALSFRLSVRFYSKREL